MTAPRSQPGTASARLDAGAKALREYEMAGKITREWADIPNPQKRKWWAKAQIVLDAAAKAQP